MSSARPDLPAPSGSLRHDGHAVRVDAAVARTLSSAAGGLRVPCIGSVPGGVYTPPDRTRSAREESEAQR